MSRIRIPGYGWIVCFIAALFYCYEYYVRIAPSMMEWQLRHDFQLTATGFGNLAAFYYYAYAPMQLFVGLFYDRLGPRILLTLACLLCALGTLGFAYAETLWLAQISRFVMGFGSAFAFVGCLKLATIWLPPSRFGFATGVVNLLGMVGAIVGDNTLSHLIQSNGWRGALMIVGFVGIVLTGILFATVRDGQQKIPPYLDSPKEEGTEKFPELLRDLKLTLKSPQIWLVGIVGTFLYLSLSGFAELWAEPFICSAYHLCTAQGAELGSMIFLGWLVSGPVVGFLSDWIQRRRSVVFWGILLSLVFILIIIFCPGMNFFLLGTCFFLYGLFSGVEILTFPMAREIASRHIAGTAVSINNMIIMIGGALIQPLIGKLLDWRWALHASPVTTMLANGQVDRAYSVGDYQIALSVLPLTLVISLVLIFFIKETYCRLQDY